MGDFDHAIALGQRGLVLATSLSDSRLQATATWYMGLFSYSLGDYCRAIDFLRSAVALLAGELLRERLGQGVTSVLCRAYLSQCCAEVGAFAEGIAWGEEGMQTAEAVENAFSLIVACESVGRLSLIKGDLYKAIPLLERSLSLCKVANISTWFSWTASDLGAAYALSGRSAEALPLLEQAVEQATSMQFLAAQTLSIIYLSEAYLLAGRPEEAFDLARRALDLSHDRKEQGHQAWALRLLGEIAAHSGPLDAEPAKAYYRQALALAEELGMRPLQAHCHLGLGTLYAKTEQQEQARTELSTAIELYRAMEMTFWLPQAEAALAQIVGRAGGPT